MVRDKSEACLAQLAELFIQTSQNALCLSVYLCGCKPEWHRSDGSCCTQRLVTY